MKDFLARLSVSRPAYGRALFEILDLSVCHNLLELICNKGLAQIYTLIWKINKSDTDLRCFNDRLYWHEGVEIWNRERKLDIMPSRQLQPLVHSLLVRYLLLRIPLSEREQNILPALALWVLSGVKCVQIIPVTLLLTRQICKIHHVNIVLLTLTHTLKRSCGSRRFTQPRHSWDDYLQLLWWETVFLEKFLIYIEFKAIIFYVSKTNGRTVTTDMILWLKYTYFFFK